MEGLMEPGGVMVDERINNLTDAEKEWFLLGKL